MGRNQPDEPQQSRLAHRGTHHKRGHHHQHQGYQAHVHSHAGGHFLAQEEQVHGPGKEQQQDKAGQQGGGKDQDLIRIGHGEVTHQPEEDIVKAGVLGEGEEKHDHRRTEGIDHDSGQNQGILLERQFDGGDDQHQKDVAMLPPKAKRATPGNRDRPRRIPIMAPMADPPEMPRM